MKLEDSMLGYAEGHLFAAFDDKIYYVNVREHFKDIETEDKEQADRNFDEGENIDNVEVSYKMEFVGDQVQKLEVT